MITVFLYFLNPTANINGQKSKITTKKAGGGRKNTCKKENADEMN